MADQLVEINPENWLKLKELYLPETPKSVLGLTTIENYVRWIEEEPNIANLSFYSLNGDWSDGTFVVIDRYHVYIDSLNDSNKRLEKLLGLFNFSKGVRFMHIRVKHYPLVVELIRRNQLQLEYDDPNLLYYMPKKSTSCLELEIPGQFYRRPLKMTDLKRANELWAFKHPGSLYYLQRLSRLNPNCGIFAKTDDELVSYVFQIQTGPLGLLYTSPEHRNQRLGTTVVANVCDQIIKSGFGVTAAVKKGNTASRSILERIGCQVIDEVHWVATFCNWEEEAID